MGDFYKLLAQILCEGHLFSRFLVNKYTVDASWCGNCVQRGIAEGEVLGCFRSPSK